MTIPLVLGAGMEVVALIALVGGILLLVAGREWRAIGVAVIVAAIGFGLLGVTYAQDFDNLPLAVTATAIEGAGVALYAATTLSMIRNRRGIAAGTPRTPPRPC